MSSGGKAYRHGYLAALPHATQTASKGMEFEGILVVIVASLLIVLLTAVATDRTVLTSIDDSLRSMVTDLGLLFGR
jgi:hypothetical protein